MRQTPSDYIDLKGKRHDLVQLDPQERQVLQELFDQAARQPDWGQFCNQWMAAVTRLYEPRQLSRRDITATLVYGIAQDLGSRLAIAQGQMRLSTA